MGVLLVAVGGIASLACGAAPAAPTGGTAAPDCALFDLFRVAGGLLLIVGLALLVFGFLRRGLPGTDPRPPPRFVPAGVTAPIVGGTVLRCRFCGALNPATNSQCSSCWAAL
ncbi:MAG TPA: hypothetical protein VFF67_07650 [Thermoplasmata archaeon]|nr:hypothetical protein [Thermoplasmata archaeon]